MAPSNNRLAEASFLFFALLFGAVFSVCSAQSLSIHHPTQIKGCQLNETEGSSVHVLTDLKIYKDTRAGLIGANMKTGQGDRQILFKDKEPDYEVDRIFNLKKSREFAAFVIR